MIPKTTDSPLHGCRPNSDEPEEQRAPAESNDASPCEQMPPDYNLDLQVGYLLRLANQRHLEIFNAELPDLTPAQLAVLARLLEHDSISQNELGRRVGIDAATTNGVIDRLARKALVRTDSDASDKRRLRISLTPHGRQTISKAIPIAQSITRQTLQPLRLDEAEQLIALLRKLQMPTDPGS